MEPIVEFDRVSKVYPTSKGDNIAVRELTFVVNEHEFIAVVGPSGCGKSTALRLLAGLIRPSSGTVRLDARPVTGPSPDIAFVFQAPALLPWRSVLQNVLLPVDCRGEKREAHIAHAKEVLELMGLGKREEMWPWQLSGGMQQRVSIARSMMLHPRLLLMDEPFGALDAITRDRLGLELLDIWGRIGNTVIFVTHNIQEAVFLSDRVVAIGASGSVSAIVEVPSGRPRRTDDIYTAGMVECQRQLRSAIDPQAESTLGGSIL